MAAAVFRGPFRALASPRFTVYWVAQGVSVIADRAYLVAFAVQLGVIEDRQGLLALALALNGVAFALPMLLLGAVVDRIGPRAAIMVGDVIRFGATLFLAAAVTAGETGAWMWISAAVLVGLGEAFFYPAFGAATPLLVPEDRLASANGLRLGVQYVGSTIGPLLVGGLLAAGQLDVVFWAQALTFLIAAAAAVAIPGRGPARRVRRPSMLHEAYDGIRFVLQRGYLVVAVAVLFVNVLLLDPSRFVFLPPARGLALGARPRQRRLRMAGGDGWPRSHRRLAVLGSAGARPGRARAGVRGLHRGARRRLGDGGAAVGAGGVRGHGDRGLRHPGRQRRPVRGPAGARARRAPRAHLRGGRDRRRTSADRSGLPSPRFSSTASTPGWSCSRRASASRSAASRRRCG